MFQKTKSIVFSALTMVYAQTLPGFAAVDWNWNQVPSDQAEIDKAMTSYQNGDIDSAVSILTNLKNGKNQDVRSRHILVDIYRTQKRYSEAKRELSEMISVFQQYVANHTVSPAWMNSNILKCEFGDICLEEGNQAEALNHYREALNAQPNLAQARSSIANILAGQGDLDGAKLQYRTLLEQPNLSTGEKSYYMGILNQLEQSSQQQQQQTSQQQHQQTSMPQHSPGIPLGHNPPNQANNDVQVQSNAQHSAAGSPNSKFATVGQPSNDPMQSALGDISAKKYESAISRLKQILEKAPANAQAHYLLAIAYASNHQSSSAKSEYEATIRYTKDPKLQSMATTGLSKLSGKQ